ncbi:MAG TPA: four helix bundle protein [Pyrinomonadaceae bacterium]|nr:four helix bundle protein [Acidobacteriota bacterium]HQZ94975.1 four helix bundle protein [Pyrinomonadaceae bacterium]
MKYSTFEELPVWQASTRFALNVFEFTSKNDFRGLGDTKNQLERASLSISNNIAEGFERGTTNELINFLYIARGSAGESRSMLRICESLDRFSDLKFEISNLIKQAINISKQLHGWLESLKNSDIKGVRFFDNKVRKKIETDKEFAEFDQQMAEFRIEFERKLRTGEINARRADQV